LKDCNYQVGRKVVRASLASDKFPTVLFRICLLRWDSASDQWRAVD